METCSKCNTVRSKHVCCECGDYEKEGAEMPGKNINQKLKEMTKLAAELADECEKLSAAVDAKNSTLKRVLTWCETESPDFEIDADAVRSALSL